MRDFEIKKGFSSLFLYYIKQIDSMLPCACCALVSHSAIAAAWFQEELIAKNEESEDEE